VSDVLPATREEVAEIRDYVGRLPSSGLVKAGPVAALLARLDAVEQALAEAVREVREHNLRPMYVTNDAHVTRWEALLGKETPR
jgi:hypothetical protein